jgi:hypothetical protein
MKIVRKTTWRDKREEILGEERATVVPSPLSYYVIVVRTVKTVTLTALESTALVLVTERLVE